MSFNIGLSGLYAANKQLDVTGNNIANVATTGFKSSRAEFEDVYSATAWVPAARPSATACVWPTFPSSSARVT